MKVTRLLFLGLLFSLIANGQGINSNWILGYQSGIGPPVGSMTFSFDSSNLSISYIPRPMNIRTTSVVMSNDLGSVLFYSNGDYIANALDDTMMNGSGLSPSHYTDQVGWDGLTIPQASFTIPWPEQPGKYLFFHCTIDDDVNYLYTRRIYLSTIDMSLDNGLGAVLNKNSILLADTFIIGRITGVKHANGRDWWLVVHGCNNDKFYIFKIDPSGISLHAVQSIGQPLISAQGQVCFSPDGSKYALYDRINNLNLFDFDRCSGTFSNPIHITLPGPSGGGGVAFSGNSNVLYVSSNTSIFQFDMTATSIVSSQTTVAVYDGYYYPSPAAATTFFLAQLAPDNKIYISSANSVLSMHVINDPDSLGLACNVVCLESKPEPKGVRY